MSTRTYITVTSNFLGRHYYEGASDNRAYLREPHSHNFVVRLKMEVFDIDREIEFHDLREHLTRYVTKWFENETPVKGSCEFYAQKIFEGMSIEYGANREYIVEVGEDTFDLSGTFHWIPER